MELRWLSTRQLKLRSLGLVALGPAAFHSAVDDPPHRLLNRIAP